MRQGGVHHRDGTPVFGMDAEHLQIVEAKRDLEFENAIENWVTNVLNESLPSPGDMWQSLRTGVILCKLLNCLTVQKPGAPQAKFTEKGRALPIHHISNIQSYQQTLNTLGFQSRDTFDGMDLVKGNNMSAVYNHLFRLSQFASQQLGFSGPTVALPARRPSVSLRDSFLMSSAENTPQQSQRSLARPFSTPQQAQRSLPPFSTPQQSQRAINTPRGMAPFATAASHQRLVTPPIHTPQPLLRTMTMPNPGSDSTRASADQEKGSWRRNASEGPPTSSKSEDLSGKVGRIGQGKGAGGGAGGVAAAVAAAITARATQKRQSTTDLEDSELISVLSSDPPSTPPKRRTLARCGRTNDVCCPTTVSCRALIVGVTMGILTGVGLGMKIAAWM